MAVPAFEHQIVGAETPAVVAWVPVVFVGKCSPHEGVIEAIARFASVLVRSLVCGQDSGGGGRTYVHAEVVGDCEWVS